MKKAAAKWISVFALIATICFSCKVHEIETEYVERIVEVEKEVPVYKEYASSVTFTATGGEGAVSVLMASETAGAAIYYTTDDTTPTTESMKYSGAVVIAGNATFKAIAVKDGMEASPVSYARFSVETKTVTTVKTEIEYQDREVEKEHAFAVSFATEETENGVCLAMTTETTGADIFYTTDGTTPTNESETYDTPLEITESMVIKAIAIKEGIEDSPVSVATVTIKKITQTVEVKKTYASAVTFQTTANENGSVTVTMTSETDGAEIHYTTDGSTPTAESTTYTEAVTVSENTTFAAIAVKSGIENSPVSYAQISISEKTVTQIETHTEYVAKTYAEAVTFTLTKNSDDSVSVAMQSATSGAEIHYTTDGATPTAQSTAYTSAVTVTGDTTFKAIAISKTDGIENSPISYAKVSITKKEITEQVKVPTEYASAVTFEATETDGGITLAMASATSGAAIYYTTDGTTPSASSTKYTSAISVSENTTIKAIAIKDGIENSPISVARITIKVIEKVVEVEKPSEGEPLKIELSVPENETNRTITVTVKITTSATVKRVVFKKNGTINAAMLLADSEAKEAKETEDNSIWTFEDTINDNYTVYTVAAIDSAGREETERLILVNQNNFVFVKGGTFDGTTTLSPVSEVFISGRTVTIGDLWVCDHEVTQYEYETYCKYGSREPSNDTYGKGDNYPAYYVSWYDAIVYCNLRSIAENLTPVYKLDDECDPRKWAGVVTGETDGIPKYRGPAESNTLWNAVVFDTSANGYRLPTEAEWEYVARGGNNGIPKTQTTYSGSDTIGDVAWYNGNSSGKTHEVKTKAANALGIYDMSGNVGERCYDGWGEISIDTPSTGATESRIRLYRGGSFNNGESVDNVYFRSYSNPYLEGFAMGFRVVRNAN